MWLVDVVIRRYIDILIIIINFPYSTCIRCFWGSSILTSLFIFKCFFGLVSVIFLQYIANVTHRTFEIVQKNRDPANIKIVYDRLPLSSLNEFYIDHERLPFGALDYYYIAYERFPLLC